MQSQTDVIAQAKRIVDTATSAGATVRLLGGIAVGLHASRGLPPSLTRTYADIDLVTTKTGGAAAMRVLMSVGYSPNERFNALNGHRRLVAYDESNGRRIDVFVGEFHMCHTIPVARRLDLEPYTVPLAELLATKLQIVELNGKDMKDILALLIEHEVGDHDAETINGAWLAELMARDWGLWRTSTRTLGAVRDSLAASDLEDGQKALIEQRIQAILDLLDKAPKTLAWRARSRLGTRAKWYDEPEEVAHANLQGA
jgi:hypothetical protein